MLPGHTPNVLGRFSCHQIGVFDGPERCHDIYSSFLAAFGHSSCERFWHVSANLRKLARTCLSRPTSIAAPGWICWRLLITLAWRFRTGVIGRGSSPMHPVHAPQER